MINIRKRKLEIFSESDGCKSEEELIVSSEISEWQVPALKVLRLFCHMRSGSGKWTRSWSLCWYLSLFLDALTSSHLHCFCCCFRWCHKPQHTATRQIIQDKDSRSLSRPCCLESVRLLWHLHALIATRIKIPNSETWHNTKVPFVRQYKRRW